MSDRHHRLRSVRNGLLQLHKAFLESERAAYERDIARITSAGQYLDLVLNDPWFHWLHELSQFIVLIDETLDRKEAPVTEDESERLIERTRMLLIPSEEGRGFARRYFEVMQRDPATVLAHRDMLRVLGTL
jgi:hypothetical protein